VLRRAGNHDAQSERGGEEIALETHATVHLS
jgi:hypothetical protein